MTYYVYVLANTTRSVLYVGVTNDLVRRVEEHKSKAVPGFTSRYGVDRLVYYEVIDDVESAILREKQLKAGSRQRKMDLVNSMNEKWRDLSYELG